MQWHWGNIGSATAGLAALIAAVAAVYGIVRYGPVWLRDSRERQQAQAAAAREQEALAREQAEQIRRERRRSVQGWSAHGVNSYEVALVTSAAEMDQAKAELLPGNVPSDYVILKVVGSTEKYGNVNQAPQPASADRDRWVRGQAPDRRRARGFGGWAQNARHPRSRPRLRNRLATAVARTMATRCPDRRAVPDRAAIHPGASRRTLRRIAGHTRPLSTWAPFPGHK
jgi:hypothetical protein